LKNLQQHIKFVTLTSFVIFLIFFSICLSTNIINDHHLYYTPFLKIFLSIDNIIQIIHAQELSEENDDYYLPSEDIDDTDLYIDELEPEPESLDQEVEYNEDDIVDDTGSSSSIDLESESLDQSGSLNVNDDLYIDELEPEPESLDQEVEYNEDDIGLSNNVSPTDNCIERNLANFEFDEKCNDIDNNDGVINDPFTITSGSNNLGASNDLIDRADGQQPIEPTPIDPAITTPTDGQQPIEPTPIDPAITTPTDGQQPIEPTPIDPANVNDVISSNTIDGSLDDCRDNNTPEVKSMMIDCNNDNTIGVNGGNINDNVKNPMDRGSNNVFTAPNTGGDSTEGSPITIIPPSSSISIIPPSDRSIKGSVPIELLTSPPIVGSSKQPSIADKVRTSTNIDCNPYTRQGCKTDSDPLKATSNCPPGYGQRVTISGKFSDACHKLPPPCTCGVIKESISESNRDSTNNIVLQSGSISVGKSATNKDIGDLVKNGPGDIEFHHLFPQGGQGADGGGRTLFKILADIDIDDYLLPLPKGQHGKLHSVNEWNPEWENKIAEVMDKYGIDKDVKKPIDPQTKAEIKKELESHLKTMLEKAGFDINNLKIWDKKMQEKFKKLRDAYLNALKAIKKGGKLAKQALACVPFLGKYTNIQDFLEALEKKDMSQATARGIDLAGDVLDTASQVGSIASKASFLARAANWLAMIAMAYEHRDSFSHVLDIQKNMMKLDEIQSWTDLMLALDEQHRQELLNKSIIKPCEAKW
jgi:hypothetical protein